MYLDMTSRLGRACGCFILLAFLCMLWLGFMDKLGNDGSRSSTWSFSAAFMNRKLSDSLEEVNRSTAVNVTEPTDEFGMNITTRLQVNMSTAVNFSVVGKAADVGLGIATKVFFRQRVTAPLQVPWTITGPCTAVGSCVQSPNFPSHYGDDQSCSIAVHLGMAIDVTSFSVEAKYDVLRVDGNPVRTTGPVVSTGGSITWSSDYMIINSGWQLCHVSCTTTRDCPSAEHGIWYGCTNGICEACDETLSGCRHGDYRGCQTQTWSGKTCQQWTSQSPHGHSRTPSNYPDKGLGDHNYCRNPGGDGSTIWCYTSDSGTRWEYCDPVPQAAPDACHVADPSRVGDGQCDETGGYNTAECKYDGGDCCSETCSGFRGCETFDCKDPVADGAFTIIFISDLENRYRGHTVGRSKYVISQIPELADKNIHFDRAFFSYKIDPQLVIHGGDLSHMWNCGSLCRNARRDFDVIWNQLYQAGIPMISTFGNHDWSQPVVVNGEEIYGGWNDSWTDKESIRSHYVDSQTMEFVKTTYETSAGLGNNFSYIEFEPKAAFGQSMFKANFRGIQLASLGCIANWKSYDIGIDGVEYEFSSDEQLANLSNSLDPSLKTLFFSHYPVAEIKPLSDKTKVEELITRFDNAAHFSGHTHYETRAIHQSTRWNDTKSFIDYTAPYPHSWPPQETTESPGMFAVLVSPKVGVLEVKTIRLEGWADGTLCGAYTTCNFCDAGKYECPWYWLWTMCRCNSL